MILKAGLLLAFMVGQDRPLHCRASGIPSSKYQQKPSVTVIIKNNPTNFQTLLVSGTVLV